MSCIDAISLIDSLLDRPVTSGGLIKARRSTLGLTQKDLADLTGLNTTYISSVENNHRSLGVHSALKFAVALGLHPSSILFPNGIELNSELKDIMKKRKSFIKNAS